MFTPAYMGRKRRDAVPSSATVTRAESSAVSAGLKIHAFKTGQDSLLLTVGHGELLRLGPMRSQHPESIHEEKCYEL
jgi:hypothetical protein